MNITKFCQWPQSAITFPLQCDDTLFTATRSGSRGATSLYIYNKHISTVRQQPVADSGFARRGEESKLWACPLKSDL